MDESDNRNQNQPELIHSKKGYKTNKLTVEFHDDVQPKTYQKQVFSLSQSYKNKLAPIGRWYSK